MPIRDRLTLSDSNLANMDPVDSTESKFIRCFSEADFILALRDIDMTSVDKVPVTSH